VVFFDPLQVDVVGGAIGVVYAALCWCRGVGGFGGIFGAVV